MSYSKTETETIADPNEVAQRVAKLKLTGGNVLGKSDALYPHYLPVWEKTKFPDWEETPYDDPGARGTPDKKHLFGGGGTSRQITPSLGEEIRGVQLSQLSKEGRDDLALLAAERGVLIFRDQDFKDIGPEKQLEFVRHYGRLHIHPTMGHPAGYPEMHVVYRDPKDSTIARYTKPNDVQSISSVNWHVDHSSEIQPPGLTVFFALEAPASGGDTLFASTTELYDRLSDGFKERLEGLQVVHDNSSMLNHSTSFGGPARFNPLPKTLHPLVRTHPVTGKKIIFGIGGFARRIYGYKKEESDYLFNFLNELVVKSGDLQLRAHYEPGTVVIWDNRVVAHTATYDFKGDERRHVVRIAAMAEKPF